MCRNNRRNSEPEQCLSLQNYEDAESVTFNGIRLKADHRTHLVQWLQTIRGPFLDDMIEQIESYFPSSQLKDFDIFKPSNIPKDIASSSVYGLGEVHSLCEFFEWDYCRALASEWTHLLTTIIESERFCELHNENALTFWSQFLQTNHIAWTDKTRMLIYTVLVLPIGSAEAERGFSIMNHIITSRRLSLTASHIDDLMRIRLNGPEKLEEFSASKYASIWVKDHKKTDDPSCQKARETALEEEQGQGVFLPQSTIF